MNTSCDQNLQRLQIVFILFLGLYARSIEALIPERCVDNITATGGSGVCCPISLGGKYVCGGEGVGTCQKQYTLRERLYEHILEDDRVHWPSKFFKYSCKCENNYFGVACDECWYGWKGAHCDERDEIVRRNILSYSPEERRMFVNIVSNATVTKMPYVILFEKKAIHSDPLWKPKFLPVDLQYWIAFVHEYTSRGTLYTDPDDCDEYDKINNNHNVVGFTTWHRYFMLFWERELRKIALRLYEWHDFAIPYWDWIDSDKCDVCVNDIVGAPGPKVDGIRLIHPGSPFSNWTEKCTTRSHGSSCDACHMSWPNFRPLNRDYTANAFPRTKDLEYALHQSKFHRKHKRYSSSRCHGFHEALEGFCGRKGGSWGNVYMHNIVHNMVKGSFCCAPTAANDPLFILHHSQVDRMMQVWFEHYQPKPSDYPSRGVDMGNCRKCNLIGFIPTVTHEQMFVDMRDLGIHYDNYKFGSHGFDGAEFIRRES